MKKQIEKLIAKKEKLITTLSHRVIIIMHPHITPHSSEHHYFLLEFSHCCAFLEFEVSSDRLCMGPHTILWAKMKDEHSPVLSSFILPIATLVPSRTGQAPSLEREGTPACPVMVFCCSFWSLGVCYARRVFCPHHDSLKRKS